MGSLGLRLGSHDRGAAAIIVALFVVVFMILLAFVIDFGRVFAVQSQMQNAADAGTLAGGQLLTCADNTNNTAAQDLAENYAVVRNGAPLAVATTTSNTLTTTTSETVDLLFGAFVGRESIPVSKDATATIVCTAGYQLFGQFNVDFNGNGTLIGPIYAGDKFLMASIIGVRIQSVSVKPGPPADPKDDPIDYKATTPEVILQRVYNKDEGTAKAYAEGRPEIKALIDAAIAQTSANAITGRCDAITTAVINLPANAGKGIKCDGGNLTISTAFSGLIYATDSGSSGGGTPRPNQSNIDITTRVTSPLIFAEDGNLTLQSGIGEFDEVAYAPGKDEGSRDNTASGNVTVNGGGTPKTDITCNGQVIGQTITVNGATLTATCTDGSAPSEGVVSLTE